MGDADPLVPRKSPCATCPYRRDVPAGVWHPEEYAKLPRYDGETWEQPTGVFMCHQADGCLCSGWVAHGDVTDLLAFRLAVADGRVDVEAVLAHWSRVPLWGSGAEAAAHGLAGVAEPGVRARVAIDKLVSRSA